MKTWTGNLLVPRFCHRRPTISAVQLPIPLMFFLLCSSIAVPPAPLERSVSPSRQFIIFGGNRMLRSVVSDAAETLKSKVLTLLEVRDHWSVPILLHLQPSQANISELPLVALNFSQTGAGLKIQLDLLIDRDFQPAILQREVLRALLLEMSYRTLPSLPAGAPYVPPPDWLVDGILTLDSETPEVFEGLDSAASHPPTLKSLVTQNAGSLDSQSRAFYRACASALVRLLLWHENGHTQLTHYIADLPRTSGDALLDLQAHFPWLGKEAEAMEKFWTENIPRVAQERRFVLMTFAATSEQLDDCLRSNVAQDREKKNPLTLEQTVRANRPNIDSKSTTELAQRLAILASRAHPLLRPVIVDYQMAAEMVARKKKHGLVRRLAGSTALREKIAARMNEVDDFMNWYEATQAKTASGVFRDYLHAADSSEEIPRRHDAISVYLDAVETELE